MKRRVLLALFVIAATGAAAQEERTVDCAEPITQADMNQCAHEDFDRADKELNEVYREAIGRQQEIDMQAADLGQDYVGAVKALKKAQRAWIDYRDGHCDGVGYQAAGGSMQGMLISGCMATMTTARTRELRQLIQGLGN